jgi:Methylmalonyl-CoA mutase
MTILSFFSLEDFNTQQEQWEKSLLSELKLTQLGNRATKRSIDAGLWPVLSNTLNSSHFIGPETSWKKASQTYTTSGGTQIEALLREDLEGGVKNFFFEKEILGAEGIRTALQTLEGQKDVEVFLLGVSHETHPRHELKVIDESQMCTGRIAHDFGGSHLEELAVLTKSVIQKAQSEGDELFIGVFADSQFFRSIAKIRAARLLAMKVLEELGIHKRVIVVALTSYRDWTLYERYSNLLRNDAAVAAALIAGADHIQSSGYQSIFEIESAVLKDDNHVERSRRMARNTSHVLSLESMLGVVKDASFGSYHLENLTEHLASGAWKKMQSYIELSDEEIISEAKKTAQARLEQLKTRKHIQVGINDFPDCKEKLALTRHPIPRFFRTAQIFENLRFKVESFASKPKVHLSIFGDHAALHARINFAKNTFELLGLDVVESTEAADIAVVVAADEDYANLDLSHISAKEKFVAGKMDVSGFANIFAGQNVFDVLQGLVSRWGKQ